MQVHASVHHIRPRHRKRSDNHGTARGPGRVAGGLHSQDSRTGLFQFGVGEYRRFGRTFEPQPRGTRKGGCAPIWDEFRTGMTAGFVHSALGVQSRGKSRELELS